MKEAQFSATAIILAYMRGYHAMRDDSKIFNDPLACRLIPQGWQPLIESSLAESLKLYGPERASICPDQATALAWVMRLIPSLPMTIGRSRYTEDTLERAIRQGVKQYVILGAGLDTFAFRRPEMLEKLQVFEVDHPATQAFKRCRLAELGWEIPAQLHFVPVDFEQESLAEALTRSSYDPQALSFFSWLGVTYYLPRDVVFDTLSAITAIAPAGSAVVFDYVNTDTFNPGKTAKRMKVLMEGLKQLGEPMLTGFDPSTLAIDLASLGWRLHENLSPSDIKKRYFHGRTDCCYPCEHQYLAWAMIERS